MPAAPRPNILLITTDQQRPDSLGCYGSAWMRTPRLDALAAAGVRFDRAYCANPVCTPSRVTLFTGQYPSRHGAWNVGCNAVDDGAFIGHALAAAGYRTHHIGKAHWQANTAPAADSVESLYQNPRFPGWTGPYHGFQSVELSLGHNGYNLIAGEHAESVRAATPAGGFSWRPRCTRPFGGEAIDWGLPTALHASVWTAERGAAFLRGHAAESPGQPFFLHLGFQDPHHPHAVPEDLPAALRVPPEAVPLPRERPGELADRPDHYRAAHEGRLKTHPSRGAHPMAGQGDGFDFRDLPEHDQREARAYHYTLCRLIDREVGRVLDTLDELGLADDTLVVFTSDHGELLGDHGLWQKGSFIFDEGLRVPLIARWPARWAGGRAVTAPISLADLAPTFLAAAGLPADGSDGHPRDGVDWLPALDSSTSPGPRDHVFIEHIDDPHKLRFRCLITADAKFARWQGADRDHELTTPNDRPLPDPEGKLAAALGARLDVIGRTPPVLLPRLAYS